MKKNGKKGITIKPTSSTDLASLPIGTQSLISRARLKNLLWFEHLNPIPNRNMISFYDKR
ncbi:MAG TPA: hypothetical protein VFJ51_01330 [Nitrososphaeraceae archaeon]|nr:hypothetical protein [Nitrososphaeraceae archaeon]